MIAKILAGFCPVFLSTLAVHTPVVDPPVILFPKARVGKNLEKMHVVEGAFANGGPSFAVTVFFVNFFDRKVGVDFDRRMQGIAFDPGKHVGGVVAARAVLGDLAADDGPVARRQRNVFSADRK